MIAGIYCEPENIDRHLNLETDGMVYCQHCYRELKAEKERLETIIKKKIKNFRDGGWVASALELQKELNGK